MLHRHQHRTIAFWTLTLPDFNGYAEHFVAWECWCGDVIWTTGTFASDAYMMTPVQWQKALDNERRAGGALAVAAQQEESIQMPVASKYDAFAPRTQRAYPVRRRKT